MSHALTSRHRRIAAAATVDKAVLYTTISAGMILARRYLTSRGIDQAFADQYGSPFGRTAAKIYRTETGTEPRKAWSNVHGKWRRVNGFLPTDTPVLDKAFVTYKRTAEYAAPAPAAEPSPAEVYVKATAGYAARFEGLTGDHLRALNARLVNARAEHERRQSLRPENLTVEDVRSLPVSVLLKAFGLKVVEVGSMPHGVRVWLDRGAVEPAFFIDRTVPQAAREAAVRASLVLVVEAMASKAAGQ